MRANGAGPDAATQDQNQILWLPPQDGLRRRGAETRRTTKSKPVTILRLRELTRGQAPDTKERRVNQKQNQNRQRYTPTASRGRQDFTCGLPLRSHGRPGQARPQCGSSCRLLK